MTVKQMTKDMDAQEFIDWMAFKILQNEGERHRIERVIAEEASVEDSSRSLRHFLMGVSKRKKPKDVK